VSSILAIVLSATLLLAQTANHTFSGKLLDAECRADNPKADCPVLPISKAFGIQTPEGKYLKLDSAGNAATLVELRKIKNEKGDLLRAGPIEASVTGALAGGTLKVDSIVLY
jgi:hypothetical protein